MEIEVTIGQLVDSEEAFNTLCNSRNLKVPYPMRLSRLGLRIMPEVKAFKDGRMTLLRQYGTSADGGFNFAIPLDKVTEFNEAVEVMRKEVVQLPAETYTIGQLATTNEAGEPNDIGLNANEYMVLDWLITGE